MTTPTLTALDLAVIIDTMAGSRAIADRKDMTVYRYTKEMRKQVGERLLSLAMSLNVTLELEAQDETQK
jgi:hypothetical protein